MWCDKVDLWVMNFIVVCLFRIDFLSYMDVGIGLTIEIHVLLLVDPLHLLPRHVFSIVVKNVLHPNANTTLQERRCGICQVLHVALYDSVPLSPSFFTHHLILEGKIVLYVSSLHPTRYRLEGNSRLSMKKQ